MASKFGTGRKLLVLLSSLALVIGLVAPAAMTVGADAVDDALATLDLVSVQGAGIKTAANAADQDLRYHTTLLADIDTLKTTLGVEEVTVLEYGTIFKPTQKMTAGEALTLDSTGIAVAKATGSWTDAEAPESFYAVLSDSADGTHAGVRVSARSFVTLSATVGGEPVTKTVYSNNGNEENTIVDGQASRSVYQVARAMLTAMQERADDIAQFRGSAIDWTDAVAADSAPADVAGADILAFLAGNVDAAETLTKLPAGDFTVIDNGETSLGTWSAVDGDGDGTHNDGAVGYTDYGYDGTKAVMLSRNSGANAIWSQLTLDETLTVEADDTISFRLYHTENVAAGLWVAFFDADFNEIKYFYGIDGIWDHRYVYYPGTGYDADMGIVPETWGQISYTGLSGAVKYIRIMTEYNGSDGYFLFDDFMVTKAVKEPVVVPDNVTIIDDGDTTLGTWSLVEEAGAVGYTDYGYGGTKAVKLSRNSGGNGIWSELTLTEPLTVSAGDTISLRVLHTETLAASLWVQFLDANGEELKCHYGIDGTWAHRYIYYPANTDLVAGDGIAPETWGEITCTGVSGDVKSIRFMTEYNADNGYYLIDDFMVTKAEAEETPSNVTILDNGDTSLGTWAAENGGAVGTTEYGYDGTSAVMLSRNNGENAVWNQLTLTEPLAVKAGDTISLKVKHTETLAAGWWFWVNDTEGTESNYYYGIDGNWDHRYIYYPTNTDLVAGDGIAPETWSEISYTVKADATITNIRIMTEYNGNNGYFIIDDFMVTKAETN